MKKNFMFSLVFFLLCLEAGVRFTGMYTTFSEESTGEFWFEWAHERDTAHYSHQTDTVFISGNGEDEWEYHSNQFGYREQPIREKRFSEISLFTIGDSFTEGLGASFDSTWPRKLEQLVQQKRDARFFNCGMSGSDPFYQYWSLKNVLINHRPTHVILSLNDSDFDDFLIRGGYSRFKPNGSVKYREAPWFLTIYHYSHIVRAVVHELFSYDYFLIRRNNRETQRAEVADSIAQCLHDINKLCIQNEVAFMAVIHPVPHSICYESEVVKSEVLALNSHSFDFPVIRMYKPLKQAMIGPDCTSYHWEQDSHFNAKGYQLFASLLYDKIQEEYPDFWEVNQASVDPVQLLDE